MGLIPKGIYRQIEQKRRGRYVAEKKALIRLQEAQAEALCLPSPGAGGSGGKDGPGDRTGRLALAVAEAEEKLETERAWEEVWRMMDRVFSFDTTPEGRVAGYLYDNGMSLKEASEACKCNRDTVSHYRDNWVCHAALIAAGDGLITIREAGK